MTMSPAVRKIALTVHVAVSVAWIGAVAAYVALDITVAGGEDATMLRGAYLGMELIAINVIVPLAIASLVSGIVMSLGTRWGLFRHYWVLISLGLTILATAVLLVETQVISDLASAAANAATSDDEVRALGNTLAHSIGGSVVLVVVFVLNIYKPRGVTPYGWRKSREEVRPRSSTATDGLRREPRASATGRRGS